MMRISLVCAVGIALSPVWAFSADYEVPSDGSLADAVQAANKNTGDKAYEIDISGSLSDKVKIKKSVLIKGDGTAVSSGTFSFVENKGAVSTLSGVKLTAGNKNETAVSNGEMGFGGAHFLTLDNVSIEKRSDVNYSGSISNTGHMIITNKSLFSQNKGGSAGGGGAIFNSSGTNILRIEDSSFLENSASGKGGAVSSISGVLEVEGSFFEKNKASDNGGSINTSGNTTISKTVFKENNGWEGGAIYMGKSGYTLTVSDSSFIGNYTHINEQGVTSYGGAIYSMSDLEITNTLFDGNYATEGGAVKFSKESKKNSVTGGVFQNNYAEIRDGGAIVHNGGTLDINGVQFIKNRAENGSGGAIFTENKLSLTGNSFFSQNEAANGGAISDSYGAEIIIKGAVFEENKALSGDGGAINFSSGSLLDIEDAVFIKNSAQGKGGALHLLYKDVSLRNVHFEKNTAENGGAVFNSGDMVFFGALFEGNLAQEGGAIYNSGDLLIKGGSSFVGNTAQIGGALYLSGDLTLDTSDGDILFRGNVAEDSEKGGADVFLSSEKDIRVSLSGDSNTLYMDGGFGGNGTIEKTGANTLLFGETADNTLFDGIFIQSAGETVVYANNFFKKESRISDGSLLRFIKTAQAGSVNLSNGGRLDLRSDGEFSPNSLTLENLVSDGTGTVFLQTDGTRADLLKVTKSASGAVILDVFAVGTQPTENKIAIVDLSGAASDADFKLAGGKVDVGAHEYNLNQEGEKWYLKTEGKLTETAKTVESVPTMHLSVVNAGMNELRKRLGDLRSANPEQTVGGWVRGYGKHLRIHDKMGARMDLAGMEGGFDVKAETPGGRLYVGVMGGYMASHNVKVFQAGMKDAKGSTKTPSAGLYATWVQNGSKWFVDLTARHFWVHTDLNDIRHSNGKNGYDIKRNFWGFTAETGRMFGFCAPSFMNIGAEAHSLITVEPKMELRYIYGRSKNFLTDMGENGSVRSTHAFSTRFNVQTSYLPEGIRSDWRLFVEMGVFNEWAGKTKINLSGTDLTTSDISGAGFESSIGFNAALSDNAYLYGALTLEAGKAYTTYLFNAGLRVQF